MSAYYIVHLQTCHCGKPATKEVQGPGNASYGKFCDRCAFAHLSRLTAPGEHADKKQHDAAKEAWQPRPFSSDQWTR